MRFPSKYIYWLLIPITLVILLDEWLKYFLLERLPDEGSLVGRDILSFAIHKNFGIAFDFPFRREFILLLSFVIGIWLLNAVYKNWKRNPLISFSAFVVLIGALGNVYDRIFYGFTVDYLIFFGRSAINLSDIVIVSGAILLLLFSQKTTRKKRKQDTIDNSEIIL